MNPEHGFRFRFPFPDEDHLTLGDIGKNSFERGVPIRVDPKLVSHSVDDLKTDEKGLLTLEITQQKLVQRRVDKQLVLACVFRDPSSGETFRVEEDHVIGNLSKQVLRHHVLNESDPARKDFYKTICQRMLEGYNLKLFVNKQQVLKPPGNANKRNRNHKGL